MELVATLVACRVECPVAQVDSQVLVVLVELVLLTMTAQLLRRSTKLFLTNLFSWFFCICNIMSWHNQAMASVSSGAFSHTCG
jgi:hypothetical protein